MSAALPWRAIPDGVELAVRLTSRLKRLHLRGSDLGARLAGLLPAARAPR